MDWLAFTGVFFLGGLSVIFLMGLFVGAFKGFPKPLGVSGKENKSSHSHLSYSRTVELATQQHLPASQTAESLTLDLDGDPQVSAEPRISAS